MVIIGLEKVLESSLSPFGERREVPSLEVANARSGGGMDAEEEKNGAKSGEEPGKHDCEVEEVMKERERECVSE